MQWYTWLIVVGWPVVAAPFVALVVAASRARRGTTTPTDHDVSG